MSAIFRAYNDWLAEFCRTDPARLKGIAMINLDDVPDAANELERAAQLGLSGAMITEYPLEHRRYDQSEYEPFWAAAAALDLPLSLHTAVVLTMRPWCSAIFGSISSWRSALRRSSVPSSSASISREYPATSAARIAARRRVAAMLGLLFRA